VRSIASLLYLDGHDLRPPMACSSAMRILVLVSHFFHFAPLKRGSEAGLSQRFPKELQQSGRCARDDR
jgi:hypothetical protein